MGIDGIKPLRRRHKQPIAVPAAKGDIGAALGQADMANGGTGLVEDPHAIPFIGAHAPAAPEIAVDIDAETIGRFARGAADEDPRRGQRGPPHIADQEFARLGARGDDIEL